jgi:hypothetical protein
MIGFEYYTVMGTMVNPLPAGPHWVMFLALEIPVYGMF